MKAFQHLKTIIRHKHEVFKLCWKCGMPWRGLVHDLSKFSPVELFQGFKYYKEGKSPVDVAIKTNGYSAAWLHHQNKNKHHPGYWVDLDHNIKVPMPRKYLVEMFCDRVAACKVYLGDKYRDDSALKYAMDKKHYDADERVMQHESHVHLIMMLWDLATCGEKQACELIRKGMI